MDGEFKLVIEYQPDLSNEAKEGIKKILTDKCGYDRTIDIDLLIEAAPFTVKRSEERGELEVFCRALRKVGARALIIEQTTTRPVRIDSDKSSFGSFYSKYTARLHAILQALEVNQIERLVDSMCQAREERRQIFVFGNGGSAALASHFATDMAKERFDSESSLFRIQSLNDNVAWFSATANDFGYENVFVQQLKTLLQPKDLVIAISSSGNSTNVLRAVEYSKSKGAETWGIVGFDGGALIRESSHAIYIPTKKGQYGFMEDVVSVLSHIVSVYIYERDRVLYT
jgi:D-sedoheptulose 7-phosphate isomerase